ncbi:class C sortase [Eubacterium sp. AB3007]|uniref:class C sortase n=1 Tax=Eubacterium sp. AB3007 TaxID=1392487 RepID=UPI0004869F0E|nr:class C sortase [Eubacterium sp. AB3007]
MKTAWKRNLAVAALLIAGLSVLFYPFISNRFYQYKADKAIEKYMKETKNAKATDSEEEIAKAQLYNKGLVGQVPPETFSAREGILHDSEYDGLLNRMQDGMMGCIEVPSIRIKLPIYHYTDKTVLEKGAGHLFGSSLPVGGDSTHAVITAHRGLPSAKMFTDLDLVKKGDLIYLYVEGKNLAYAVDQIKTVDPEDCSDLGIEEGKDQVTLVTCTPYGKNTERLLVRGQRTKYPGQSTPGHHRFPLQHILFGLAGILSAILLIILIRVGKRRWARRTP